MRTKIEPIWFKISNPIRRQLELATLVLGRSEQACNL